MRVCGSEQGESGTVEKKKQTPDLCSFSDGGEELSLASSSLWPLCSPSGRPQERSEQEAGWGRGAGLQCLRMPVSLSPLAGTRSAVLNTEARTVEADVLSRRCVMMRLVDFSYEQYQKALRQSAGAVVIILPRSISSVPQDVVRVNRKVFLSLPRGRCIGEKLGRCRAGSFCCNAQQKSYSKTSLCFGC